MTHTVQELRAKVTPKGPWFPVPAGSQESECRSCGAGIYWIQTPAGKRMPVDAYVAGGSAPTETAPGRGVSHFATCPDSPQWRVR